MRAGRVSVLVSAAALLCLPAARGTAQVKVTTSNGDVVTYTEKNLVDHLIVGDSIELEMAQLAVMRTQNTAVRDYANMLVTDHRNHLEALRKIAAEHDVGRQALASDTAGVEAIRALTSLREMPADSGFDNAFVRQQIAHHKQDIIELKMFGGAAKDDDLKDDIKHTLPVLERHLARAREVAAHLGIPADSGATTTTTTTTTTTVTKKPH
jgi:predicted outer membrane protein